MVSHITYASDNMSIIGLRCSESALRCGCDKSVIHKRTDPQFYNSNRAILDAERGAGYWLWKPYIIYRELQRLSADDILIYTDASMIFLDNISPLLKEFDGEIMLFGSNWDHKEWCKMDVLVEMGCDKIETEKQLYAGLIILRKTDFTLKICKEWLTWAQKPGMIDDSFSRSRNVANFRDHRHDQAILTNLAYLYQISFNWWPCTSNIANRHLFPENRYPALFRHVRKMNSDYGKRLYQLCLIIYFRIKLWGQLVRKSLVADSFEAAP